MDPNSGRAHPGVGLTPMSYAEQCVTRQGAGRCRKAWDEAAVALNDHRELWRGAAAVFIYGHTRSAMRRKAS